MTDIDAVTIGADLADADADRDIAEAVSARQSLARKYVLRLRRRSPESTPAEVISMLERRYASAITTAGVAVTAAGIAADIGISLIPLGGAVASGAKAAGKEAAKAAAKSAAKGLALGAAKGGAQRVSRLLPAGEQQLQFEITAIFALAIADIHGLEYDKDQAHALVFGITNERVSQQQIASMAADVAQVSSGGSIEVASTRSGTQAWATTLANSLPGGAAQSLVRTMQTGQLDVMRDGLSEKHQAAVDYGVSVVAGGVSRFVFGREVVKSARGAFPAAPAIFPPHLAITIALGDDTDDEQNGAIAALEEAGSRLADVAGVVGGGVVSAAGAATSVFRSVDLDGDGIPDEARALTALKGAGGAAAGAANAVSGRFNGLLKRAKRGGGAAAFDIESTLVDQ